MNCEIISKNEQLSQLKNKVDFKNLKSDYLLKKVFTVILIVEAASRRGRFRNFRKSKSSASRPVDFIKFHL